MNESDVWIYLQLTDNLNLTYAVEAYGLLELIDDHQYQNQPNVFGGLSADALTGVDRCSRLTRGVTGADMTGMVGMTGAGIISMTGN